MAHSQSQTNQSRNDFMIQTSQKILQDMKDRVEDTNEIDTFRNRLSKDIADKKSRIPKTPEQLRELGVPENMITTWLETDSGKHDEKMIQDLDYIKKMRQDLYRDWAQVHDQLLKDGNETQ